MRLCLAIASFLPACGYRPGDSFELPLGWLAVMLIAVPVLLAVFLGLFAFRRLTPFLFQCRRCGHEFHGVAGRGYPEECPGCRSPDWNTSGT